MIRILIAGDFCPKERVAELIEKEDYKSVFGEIREYTSKVDYSIVNLEAPIVESLAKPIEKCGPNLKCSSNAVKALKYAGFDMVTLANNHFYDYGDEGVRDTLKTCKKEGITIVGGGKNISEASKIVYIEIEGLRIAIINCCENESSIATANTGGSNPLNSIKLFYDIQEAKKVSDKVIVIVHGGFEECQLPSLRMKECYHFFLDVGADVVINHHQHCHSGYEIYNGKPIFYGLGNFCFDRRGQRNDIWNKGFMLELIIENENMNFEIIPYIQCDESPCVSVIKDSIRKSDFKNELLKLNQIICNDDELKTCQECWMRQRSWEYLYAVEPYRNRWFAALYIRSLLPSFLSKKKRTHILNYINCESHLERLKYALMNICN